MYVSQRALLYPGATGGDAGPPLWGEAATIETQDGERLHALHAAAPEGGPTILFFHGNADRIARYGFLADALSARGIGLLALSYRGYPGSTGRPSEEGLLADGLAAFDWLAARTDGPIVLLGQSLGSGVAVHVATERPTTAVVLLSAFDSILAVASRAYFFLPVAPLIKDAFRSDLRIARVPQPKLFIHGRRDGVIALAHGEALFAVAPEPKRMMILDRYGHNDIWNSELAATIADFVEESCRPSCGNDYRGGGESRADRGNRRHAAAFDAGRPSPRSFPIMPRQVLAASIFLAALALPAQAQPPADARPLSEILAALEAQGDVAWFDEVEWDDDGYWEIDYHRADGGRVEIKVDPVSGEPRR